MHIPFVKPILRIAALIVSLVIYAATVLAAYGGRFNTEFFTFPAVMTLALPYLATATLLITVAWFAGKRIFAGGLGVLALVCSWSPVTTACPLGSTKKPTPGTKTFTLMTYNIIHGWPQDGRDSTANRTFEYIINSGADIVCVQELIMLDSVEVPNLNKEQMARLRKTYPYYAGEKSNDIKVFSKYPLKYEDGKKYIDEPYDIQCYAFYKVNIDGRELSLVNMHLKSYALSPTDIREVSELKNISTMKRSFSALKGQVYKKLKKGFAKRRGDVEILRNAIDTIKGPLIICGDLNDVPESYAYRLLRGEDLHDAYVETGFGPMITFNAHKFWFHLDQIFYRGDLQALDISRGKLKASDHYPVKATFEFTK